MDKDTHVYCTQCKNFEVTNDVETMNVEINCKYEDECDFWNPEDSLRFEDRPHYQPSNM